MTGIRGSIDSSYRSGRQNVCGKLSVLKGKQNSGFVCSASASARQHNGDASRERLPEPRRILRQAGTELLALFFEQVLRLKTIIDERSIPRFQPCSVGYCGTCFTGQKKKSRKALEQKKSMARL